jgi:uncharacterized protein (TIGR01244 family)
MSVSRLPLFLALLACTATALAAQLPEIPNSTQPSAGVLIGGQPDEAALGQAADAGIRVVVNLRGEDEQLDFDEAGLVSDLGMTYLQLPIAGASDLTPENVRAFSDLLAAIGDQPVLMHCSSGNRVGALYALHAGMYQGMDVEAAIEFGRAHGLTRLEDEVRTRLVDFAAQ